MKKLTSSCNCSIRGISSAVVFIIALMPALISSCFAASSNYNGTSNTTLACSGNMCYYGADAETGAPAPAPAPDAKKAG